MDNIAIKVEHLSKYYKLGVINNGTLFRDIQSYIARLQGKADPHGKIGADWVDDKEGFWALKDLNFEVKKGDRIGIIGHNGAGKSTLLKVLSQITSPTEGEIKINGRVASLLEVGTGFHPELTGRENIYMNGSILGMKKKEIDRKVNEIISFSEINEHIDTPVKRYSSGMYVRLAFAVAAHLDSEILIADEVLAVGDAAFQRKALGKMHELSTGEGRTILFVSHNMATIKNLCNNAILLNKGKLVNQGPVNEIINNYLLKSEENLTNDKQLIQNSYFNLIDYYITDCNSNKIEQNIINNSDDFYINIEFDYKQVSSLFCIGYSIFDSNGTEIYWSYNTDSDESKWVSLKKGKNHIYSKIPSHFLNEGSYVIKIISTIHFQEWITSPENGPELFLRIHGKLSESPYWLAKRPGICAPVIEWKKNFSVEDSK